MTFPRFAPWNSMIGDSTLTPRVTTHEVKEEGRKATPTKSSGSKCNCRTQAIPHANISSSTSAARSLSPLGKNVPNRYCQKSSFRRNTFSAPFFRDDWFRKMTEKICLWNQFPPFKRAFIMFARVRPEI